MHLTAAHEVRKKRYPGLPGVPELPLQNGHRQFESVPPNPPPSSRLRPSRKGGDKGSWSFWVVVACPHLTHITHTNVLHTWATLHLRDTNRNTIRSLSHRPKLGCFRIVLRFTPLRSGPVLTILLSDSLFPQVQHPFPPNNKRRRMQHPSKRRHLETVLTRP